MKAFRKNIMPLIVLLVIGGIAKAQSFPIVLTQKLPWAPSNIEANATKEPKAKSNSTAKAANCRSQATIFHTTAAFRCIPTAKT